MPINTLLCCYIPYSELQPLIAPYLNLVVYLFNFIIDFPKFKTPSYPYKPFYKLVYYYLAS